MLDKLGGYLQIGSLGPSSISPLMTKINDIGPTPIVGIYYDLSYGRNPQTLLIIDGPNASPYIFENAIRWLGPKAPPYEITNDVPELFDELLKSFLPPGLSNDQKNSERNSIYNFIRDFYQVCRQKTHTPKALFLGKNCRSIKSKNFLLILSLSLSPLFVLFFHHRYVNIMCRRTSRAVSC
jgi:hypothetical protein